MKKLVTNLYAKWSAIPARTRAKWFLYGSMIPNLLVIVTNGPAEDVLSEIGTAMLAIGLTWLNCIRYYEKKI
jgi:hypothetical protein